MATLANLDMGHSPEISFYGRPIYSESQIFGTLQCAKFREETSLKQSRDFVILNINNS